MAVISLNIMYKYPFFVPAPQILPHIAIVANGVEEKRINEIFCVIPNGGG